jgi:hypothetical protein
LRENVSIEESIRTRNASLTGVPSAILPMTFAIGNKDGKRLEFTMLVNPENVNHGKTTSTHLSYTRSGYVSQLWGPNQDILTATGKSAAFMTPETGTTSTFRSRAFGFLNMMSLVSTYKNNGYLMLDRTKLENIIGGTRVIDMVQGVEIYYDNQLFMGHFNNFTTDEIADTPYVFNYNFEFVISSLSQNYSEIRGHFKNLIGKDPKKKQIILLEDVDTNIINEEISYA